MKHDPDFEAAQEGRYRVAAAELRSFVERYERLEAEKKDIAEQQKRSWPKQRAVDTTKRHCAS